MLITEERLRQRASLVEKAMKKSAGRILMEHAAIEDQAFDIFLSHSKADEELILGAKELLEDDGFTVYVDWIQDPQLDRTKVTQETAAVLRERMAQCGMLVYAHSLHSSTSTWMPWELGFFDGMKGKIAILPIAASDELEFKGNEYLGLYPYLDHVPARGATKPRFWVNRSYSVYANLDLWLRKNVQIQDRSPS